MYGGQSESPKPTKAIPFREAAETLRRRFYGLFDEWKSLKIRWEKLKQALGDERLLPPIEDTVAPEVTRYFQLAEARFNAIDDQLSRSTPDLSACEVSLEEIHRQIADVAKMLFLLKMGVYQRTVSLELPYVIAGLPRSMEREIGSEMFLVAADNTIRNYRDLLNLFGTEWDQFVSYYPIFLEDKVFPGALYIRLFQKTVHIALSHDTKYCLEGYLALAHEVGHTALETRDVQFPSVHDRVPLVMWRFLVRLFQYCEWFSMKMTEDLDDFHCSKLDCDIREIKKLAKISRFEDFVREIAVRKSSGRLYIELADQILADVVALRIAGPNYIRTLFNYSFSSILSKRGGLPQLSQLFQQLFIRAAACASFAKDQGFSWSASPCDFFDRTEKMYKDAVRSLNPKYHLNDEEIDLRSAYDQCLLCQTRLGIFLGSLISFYSEEILGDLFKPNSSFSVENGIEENILDCKVIDDREPRQILHAYCELLLKQSEVESTTVLYSLANNRQFTWRRLL